MTTPMVGSPRARATNTRIHLLGVANRTRARAHVGWRRQEHGAGKERPMGKIGEITRTREIPVPDRRPDAVEGPDVTPPKPAPELPVQVQPVS
jgi:hypothetical protein